MAVERSLQIAALVGDAGFINRLESFFGQAASAVEKESGGTSNHAARAAYAKLVLQNARGYAVKAAHYVVHLDNFEGHTIEFVPMGSGGTWTIDVTDADAFGNIFFVWNDLAALFG